MNSLQDDSFTLILAQDQKYDKLKEDLRMLKIENKKL